MPDVFISYSSREYPEAETLRRTLVENGISCWMAPDSIPGGSNYTKEIPVAIRKCPVFVLVLSEWAQASHWVLKELDAAVSHGKVILPFMLKNFTLSDEFSFLLSGTQWYPAYQDADAELEKMIDRIKSITSAPPARPSRRRPRSVPQPEPAPAPAPQPEPIPQRIPVPEICCPACGSPVVQQRKKGKGSYDFAESLRFLIVPLLLVIVPTVVFFLATTLSAALQLSEYDSFWETIVACVASVPVCIILGIKSAKEQIRRRRVRKHIRASGATCCSCAKKFRIAIPFGTPFPWEYSE